MSHREQAGQPLLHDTQPTLLWDEGGQTTSARAIYQRGLAYATGEGLPQDDALAAECFRKAAALGHAEARFRLGYCYLDGLGVPEDDAQGMSWIRKAADLGNE